MGFAAAASWGLVRLGAAPQRRTAVSLKSSCRINWTRLGIKEPVWSLIFNSWRLSSEERAAKTGAAFLLLPLYLPFGWILHLPAITFVITANNDGNNNKGPNWSATKTCSQTVFFIFLWSSRLFKVEISETAFNAFWDKRKWKHALQPHSHFFKCFDLSYQSAHVMSFLLLPVSPRFLIKARWLAGCPWSVRNAGSKLRHESGIQRPSSLTFF